MISRVANVTQRRPILMTDAFREIQNDRSETGSGNNFAPIIGRNETSNANTMFSRITDTTESRLILNDCCVWMKFNKDAQKPEVVKFT
jgi:hypothetical protein